MKRPAIGKRRNLVSIKARTDTGNIMGGIDDNLTETAKAWAQIDHVSAAQYLGATQFNDKFTHWITIPYISGLTTGHVIDRGAQRFRISRIRTIEDKERYLLIEAREDQRA